MNNETKYSVKAPIGNTLAPVKPVTEQELRDYAVSLSPEKTWHDKFLNDPIEDVLEILKTGGFIITKT